MIYRIAQIFFFWECTNISILFTGVKDILPKSINIFPLHYINIIQFSDANIFLFHYIDILYLQRCKYISFSSYRYLKIQWCQDISIARHNSLVAFSFFCFCKGSFTKRSIWGRQTLEAREKRVTLCKDQIAKKLPVWSLTCLHCVFINVSSNSLP